MRGPKQNDFTADYRARAAELWHMAELWHIIATVKTPETRAELIELAEKYGNPAERAGHDIKSDVRNRNCVI